MRGHDDLIRMRTRGAKPAGLVFVDDYAVQPGALNWLAEGFEPRICTHGDSLNALDLRFLIGLKVAVTGDVQERVRVIAAACRKAGAELVIASCGERDAVWKKGDAKWLSF